jgi:phosphopentomutase
MLDGGDAVSRVIARPFEGTPGDYRRTAGRRDFSLEPPGVTLLDALAAAGVPRVGIGKVDDLFAHRHIASEHTPTNADAYRRIEETLRTLERGLVFVNVIEFDQTWGHRNDVPGYVEGLQALDAWIPRLEALAREDDLIILTADHGNDPTTPSTDHSREAVPVLCLGPRVRPVALGARSMFADVGARWRKAASSLPWDVVPGRCGVSDRAALVAAARAAMANAHHLLAFHVGAAIEAADGRVFRLQRGSASYG